MLLEIAYEAHHIAPAHHIDYGVSATLHPKPIYVEGSKDGVAVEVAIQYNDSYQETMFAFANNINTHDGGTHLVGFRAALTRTINSYAEGLWLAFVTAATVGYGDFTPKTSLGKVGAIILIFSGVSTGLYVITHVGLLRERTIDPQVQRRLEILRNLTSLQTGTVEKSQLKAIKEKIQSKSKEESGKDDRNRGFGSL